VARTGAKARSVVVIIDLAMIDLQWSVAVRAGRELPLPFGSSFTYNDYMVKSISVVRKKRGRPATGTDPLLTVRAPTILIEAIDAWATKEGIARSEAVRRLIEVGLKAKR